MNNLINLEELKGYLSNLISLNMSVKRNCESLEAKELTSLCLIEAQVSGASGGNCWGGSASSFSEDDSDIKSDYESSVKYRLRDLKVLNKNNITLEIFFTELTKDFSVHSTEASYSDNDDYYGNYRDYNIYSFSFDKLLNLLLENNLIDKETLISINSFLSEKEAELSNQYLIDAKTKRLDEVNKSLASFTKDSQSAYANLQKRIVDTEKLIEKLKSELEKHNEKSKKSKAGLEKEKKELDDFFEIHKPQKPNKLKK